MERLWTPWRRAFIEEAVRRPPGGEPDCFLCAKPAEPCANDRANLIVYRGPRAYALLNLYPYNPGHLLVAPYVHTGDLPTLDPAVSCELFALVQRATGVLQAVYQPQGMNIGLNLGQAAGAGVPGHLHVHIVPRWNGDTNFMPVLSDTKVMPETPEQSYDRLRPHFDALSSEC